MVLESKIDLRVIPEGSTAADPDQGLHIPPSPTAPQPDEPPYKAVYTPEATVALSLSADPTLDALRNDGVVNPSEVDWADAIVNRKFDRAFNTTVRYTRQTIGSEAVAAQITGTYDPHRIYDFDDIGDHLEDFSFTTGSAGTTNPTEPTQPAYWSLVIGPHPSGTSYIYQIEQGNPNSGVAVVVPGVPVPHRVSARITYKVMFYTPEPSGIENVPLSGPQASATGPSLGGIFEGADGSSFDQRASKRSRDEL